MRKDTKMILNISRRLLLDTDKSEKQIAKMLYISESSLRQLYLQSFGTPPRRYIRSVKLKKAQTLLRISNKSISEIAYKVGYINASKFAEAFKNQYNITPSIYRKAVFSAKKYCSFGKKYCSFGKKCGFRVDL